MVGWGIREEINPLVIIRHMFGRIIRAPRLIASFLQESGNLWTIGHSVEVIRPLTLVCNVLNEIRKKKNKENEVYTTNIDDPNPRIRLSVRACVTKRPHLTHYPQANTLSAG